MVDLDDTLVSSLGESLDTTFVKWLTDLRASDVPVVILSNGQRGRVERYAKALGIRGFSLIGKPLPHAFRQGLKALGTQPHETAMIGDQLFTDVFGANVIGMISILVTPLSPGSLPHTRLFRKLEARILKGG